MDEAVKEWYNQSVVSAESDFDGPIDLFHEYDGLSDPNTPDVDMDGVFTNYENMQGRQYSLN
jgi:hypothetical protein